MIKLKITQNFWLLQGALGFWFIWYEMKNLQGPRLDWLGQKYQQWCSFWTISQACIRKEDTHRKGNCRAIIKLWICLERTRIFVSLKVFAGKKSTINKILYKNIPFVIFKKHSGAACIILWLNSRSFKTPKPIQNNL